MLVEFGKSVSDFLAAHPSEEKQPSRFAEQSLSDDLKEKIRHQYFAAREAAISYIGISQRFSGAVYRKLLQKNVPAELAQYVVARLIKDEYINDLRLIKGKLRNRRERDYESIKASKRRFMEQGCSASAFQQAVEELQLDDFQLCNMYVSVKHGLDIEGIYSANPTSSCQKLFYEKPIQKIVRQVMGRGFSGSLVRTCILLYMEEIRQNTGDGY